MGGYIESRLEYDYRPEKFTFEYVTGSFYTLLYETTNFSVLETLPEILKLVLNCS